MNRNSNNDSMNATGKRELNGSILLYNGNFFRFDGKKNYTWMWIQEGMIRDAGYRDCDAGYLAMAEEAVDLKGSLVLPGFYDCHVHVVPTALDRMKLDLNGSRNFEEMGTRLREWAERYPRQSTVYACRLEISDLEEKCLPNRQVIDQFLRDYDVWIECRDFHCTILNTKALHSINIPWTIEGVEVDEFMRPTGIFRGKANALLRQKIGNSYNIQDKERAVLDLSKQLLKKGVTSIHAMEGGEGFPEQDVKLLLSCIPRLRLYLLWDHGAGQSEGPGPHSCGGHFFRRLLYRRRGRAGHQLPRPFRQRDFVLLPGGGQSVFAQLLSGGAGYLPPRCGQPCGGTGAPRSRICPARDWDIQPPPSDRARRADHKASAQTGRRHGDHFLHAARV